MRQALDDLPAGALILSKDLRIVTVNRELSAISGRPPDELIGQSIDILLSAPARILFQSHVYPALRAEGRVEEAFLSLAPRDGPSVPVLFNAARAADSDGYHCLVVRIRARSAWEQELLEATKVIATERAASERLANELASAAAELAERYAVEQRERQFRDAFIGIISHELRTPITTIFGMSHVLRGRFEQMVPAEVREVLDDIREESDRLRRLVEDLLVLGRTEHGRLDVTVEPTDVAHAVRPIVKAERERAADYELTIDVEPGLPPVMGDEVLLGQVLRNYLTNAVKYSPPKSRVQVTATSEAGGVAIRVCDSGPGIGTAPPERLFELFYRTSDAARRAPGAGIGLFVCREIVTAFGGRTWARNRPAPEKGAEFGLWLRRADADDGDDRRAHSSPMSSFQTSG